MRRLRSRTTRHDTEAYNVDTRGLNWGDQRQSKLRCVFTIRALIDDAREQTSLRDSEADTDPNELFIPGIEEFSSCNNEAPYVTALTS